MKEIAKVLSSIRHPTSSFVNEDTFPAAIEAMPALKNVAASGFRGDKTFDDGFMSAASAAYDALTDASIPGLDHVLASFTLEAVNRIDTMLQEDKEFAKTVITELNVGRFLKSKAHDSFKAGALLALTTLAFGDELPPVDDDDKPREVVKEKPLGEPTDETPEEPGMDETQKRGLAMLNLDALPAMKDVLPILVDPKSGQPYFKTVFTPATLMGKFFFEIKILFGLTPATEFVKMLTTLEAKGLKSLMVQPIHSDGLPHEAGTWIAVVFHVLP